MLNVSNPFTKIIFRFRKFTKKKVNTDLTGYVTERALNGLFVKVAEEEANIRKKTDYYRRVKNNWVRDDSIGEETFFDNKINKLKMVVCKRAQEYKSYVFSLLQRLHVTLK